MALVEDDGGARLDGVELPGAGVDAGRAGDAAGAAAGEPGDEQPVDQLHAFGLERAAQLPGKLQAAAFGMHDAGEIEPAGRAALVLARLIAGERHADRLEILQPRVGILQRVAHQDLVGDAVVAGHDLVQDAVEIVVRQRHDGPGVGERGVAGAADQPRIAERDAGAGRAMTLGGQCRQQTPRPRSDHQHVGVDQHAVEMPSNYHRHQGRGRFFTDGCTSTIFSGQKISQLKQVMQCSRNLITGRSLVCVSPATCWATGTASIWMTSAGHTTSQMPQPVHFSSSMLSIIPLHSKTCPARPRVSEHAWE